MKPAKLILQNSQAPGDILMLTAAVRDWQVACGAGKWNRHGHEHSLDLACCAPCQVGLRA